VKLRTMFFLYLRARIVSWLHMDTQTTYVFLSSLERCEIASFTNGLMDKPRGVPNTIPEDWGSPGSLPPE